MPPISLVVVCEGLHQEGVEDVLSIFLVAQPKRYRKLVFLPINGLERRGVRPNDQRSICRYRDFDH